MFIMVAAGWKLFLVLFMIHGCLELSLSPSMEDEREVASGSQDVISQYPVVLQNQIK